jgi:hypothetical protein
VIYRPSTGRELAQELIDTTGNTLLEDQIGKLPASEQAEFEAYVFKCDHCGFWCGQYDLILGSTCRECAMQRKTPSTGGDAGG